jgi:hypothetical protein
MTMSSESNTNNELSSLELDAIVGGNVANTLGGINYGVGLAMNPAVTVGLFVLRGATSIAKELAS